MTTKEAESRHPANLATPLILGADAVQEITGALNTLLADIFAIYLKTKNFHWQISGPHFRDYYLMLADQADRILDTTDAIAERMRKLGGAPLRSIGHIARLQRILDNDADYVTPRDMLAELGDDNKQLTFHLEQTRDLCDQHGDVATARLLQNWIDEAEQRTWILLLAGCAQRAAA